MFIISLLSPLDLQWEVRHRLPPNIKEYSLIFGNLDKNPIVYRSPTSVMGMEREVHLYFYEGKLRKIDLILGPHGIDKENCMRKHKNLSKLMEQKYGKVKHTLTRTESTASDMVYTNRCQIVTAGLHEVTHQWKTKEYLIFSKLLGDQEGIYIEVTYFNRNNNKYRQEQKKRILKKISRNL
jgi:hypothetical protein